MKHLNSKLEEEVPVSELARYLSAALGGGSGAGGPGGAGGSRPASSAGYVALRSMDEHVEGEGEGEASWRDRRRRDKR